MECISLLVLCHSQLITDETSTMQELVKDILEQGKELLQAAEDNRDPATHARVSNRLMELKVWHKTKKRS